MPLLATHFTSYSLYLIFLLAPPTFPLASYYISDRHHLVVPVRVVVASSMLPESLEHSGVAVAGKRWSCCVSIRTFVLVQLVNSMLPETLEHRGVAEVLEGCVSDLYFCTSKASKRSSKI